MPASSRRLRLLLNGKAAADPAVRAAVAEVRQRGHVVEPRPLWEPGDAVRCAADAAKDGCDVVVAAGGDGTLNEAVNGLLSVESKTALAAMPFGTANDFARAAGVFGLSPLDALRLAAEQTPTPIDVGKCNDRHFLNVASGGFGAEVTASTPGELKSFLGGFAYTLTGMLKLITDEERQVRVVTPKGEWSGPLLLFTVANARLAGGGYVVAPKAKLDDGLLDYVAVSSLGWQEGGFLGQLFVEREMDATHGPGSAVPSLQLTSPRPLHVNLDGEPLPPTNTYRFDVLPKRLAFVLPAGAKGELTGGA